MPYLHKIAWEVAEMGFLTGFLMGIVQIICFFLVVKIGQILFWNLRKYADVHPVWVEIVLAIILVLVLHAVESVWALLIIVALAIGVVRGDQEELTQDKRVHLR
jgi:hypothetical protein